MMTYKTFQSTEFGNQLKTILAGGTHSNYRYKENRIPIQFADGSGSRLWDVDGNEYLDLYAKSGAMIFGHKNKEYTDSIANVLDNLLVVDLSQYDFLACEVLQKHFANCEMVRFGLSGSEMVQNALRLARGYTGRNRILRFEGHFHGNADNMLGGRIQDISSPIPFDDGDTVFSTEGRANDILESQTLLIPWNDVNILENTIHKYKDDIAAIITEPICLNGGSILPQQGYLETVRSLCDDYNIVLIFDEVITGARIGPGGAQALLNIVPDLTILGKCIAGGFMPVSALLGKSEIMELYANNRVIHGGTFNGYPLSLAGIISTFSILSRNENEAYKNMESQASRIYEIFTQEAREIGLDAIIQGPLSCASYHCTNKQLSKYKELTKEILLKNGILRDRLAVYGILTAHTSRLYPNISLTDDDVIFFRERIKDVLLDTQLVAKRILKSSSLGNL